MKKLRFFVYVVALVFLLGSISLAGGAKEAEKEGELASFITLYEGSGAAEVGGEVCKFISEKVGTEIKFTAESHGVIHSKIKAEAPHFTSDMCLNIGWPLVLEAKEKGWSVAYDSPNWKGAGDVWVDPEGYWWDQGNWAFVLVGNKDLLAKTGYKMPESWNDLLDPKWKGHIVMPSPLTSGTAFMMLYSFMALYGGEQEGWEFLEALNKNIDHYTRGGNVPSDLVGRGEFMLGISSDEMVLPRIREGYPLEWKVPKEGIGYGSAGAIILKGTKKLYTCQKVIDFLGTTEFCQFWSDLAGYVTKDPKVKPALYGEMPKYIKGIDQGWAVANKDRLINDWKEKIGRVPEE